jgi:hypothetical protein
MTTYRRVLRVAAARCDDLERFTAEGFVGKTDRGTEFDEEVVFRDGRRMAIQVCRCRGESYYAQGVLFDADGNERGCTTCGDGFAGEFEVECDDNTYIVDVRRGL